jgi:Fe(3+) dicitrate transport protein
MVLAYDQTLECAEPAQTSEKITLMEDGVLISPAPYSAPAAYYFPTVSRMQSFEILKGSQIQYGPYTTGGAINMVSTKFQDVFQAVLLPA